MNPAAATQSHPDRDYPGETSPGTGGRQTSPDPQQYQENGTAIPVRNPRSAPRVVLLVTRPAAHLVRHWDRGIAA